MEIYMEKMVDGYEQSFNSKLGLTLYVEEMDQNLAKNVLEGWHYNAKVDQF